MKRLKWIVLSTLLFAACRYPQAEAQAPAVNRFEAGTKFRITLPENHEKKESWSLEKNSGEQVLSRLNDVWHGNEKGIDFNFEARAAGTATLTFIKRVYSDTVETVNYVVEITDN